MNNKDNINNKEEILFVNDSPDTQNSNILGKIDPKKVSKEDSNKENVFASQGQESIEIINERLKKSLKKILQFFNKTISDDVLYSSIPIDNENEFTTQYLIELVAKFGLTAEMRRVNILDINSGPALLLLSNNNNAVLLDEKTIYNPNLDLTQEFNPEDLIQDYIGYSLFFYEEDLKMSTFLKKTGFLFKSIGTFKSIFLEILLLAFFINIFAIVSPLFTMNVYDRVIPNNAISTLLVLSLGMTFVYIFDFIFKIIKTYLSDYISFSVGHEVDQVLMKKILLAKAPGINMSSGAKSSLFKELSMVREFYFSRFIPSLIDIPFLILFFLVLFYISPVLTLVPFVASILIFVVNILLQVPIQNTHHDMLVEDQQKGNILIETVSNVESIKTFNYIGRVLTKWKLSLDKSYKRSSNYNIWVNISSNFSVFVMNIVTILAVIVGVFEINENLMTTGGLIAATTIVSRIMTTIIGFSSMVVRYRSIQNTLKHLEKIVNYPMEDETNNYGKKGSFKGNIEFKNITFFYPGLENPILNKCNFSIKENAKVAIIGKTGAGKSTITRLLLGLDFANQGQICIDNYDINNIHIAELRANIGFMPQKSFFFQGTIKDNIIMNNVGIDDEKYKKACEIAGVSLITELSGSGDDMLIQEGGKNLSGGQQQIIALARAVLNDPPIIIMDEPTNGMDTSLEASFMERTKNFVKNKTFILITHKPSQLTLVDRVILIDKSTIIIDDTKEKVISMLQGKKE